MPKRVIDGEGLWRSEKLARVQPEKFRAEYANQIPLAWQTVFLNVMRDASGHWFTPSIGPKFPSRM